MIVNNDIDIKLYYRFIEFVAKLSGISLPHERFKLIVLDNFKAESKDEIFVKRFSEAYLYLLNNVNQTLTKEVLIRAYFLLTNTIMEDDKALLILSTYYKNYDEVSHYLSGVIHFTILNNVDESKIEFARQRNSQLTQRHYITETKEIRLDQRGEDYKTIFLGHV